MKTAVVPLGSRIVDSYPYSAGGTEEQASKLKAAAVDGFIGYLGSMNKTRLAWILAAGLGFMPVTFAGEYKDGAADELAQLAALAIPKGTTVWLDLEGIDAWNTPADKLTALIEAWAAAIVGAGYIAGLYVGAPQPLNGKQLYALKHITRYWLGIGRCVGKEPKATRAITGLPDGVIDAYPECGWCMRQDWHNNPDLALHGLKGGMLWRDTGVFVDTNSVQADHKGRLPVWVVA